MRRPPTAPIDNSQSASTAPNGAPPFVCAIRTFIHSRVTLCWPTGDTSINQKWLCDCSYHAFQVYHWRYVPWVGGAACCGRLRAHTDVCYRWEAEIKRLLYFTLYDLEFLIRLWDRSWTGCKKRSWKSTVGSLSWTVADQPSDARQHNDANIWSAKMQYSYIMRIASIFSCLFPHPQLGTMQFYAATGTYLKHCSHMLGCWLLRTR